MINYRQENIKSISIFKHILIQIKVWRTLVFSKYGVLAFPSKHFKMVVEYDFSRYKV